MLTRAAHEDEAEALTSLALRSKAHWGYDDAFLEASRPDLTITRELVPSVLVAVFDTRVVGFASLLGELPELEIGHCFVDPASIRAGVGRRLVSELVQAARRRSASMLEVVSDPNAEDFYVRLGFARIGDAPSIVDPRRRLPLLGMELLE